ncbi:MAG TPA: hypothetical protein EYP68_05250 [Candidatus Korarchaeota archaeon]|nr:hypothetical protein [Candidatus Korarchaeota archaeon]
MDEIIKVREKWRGTKGGTYYYIRENNILRHISEYAINRTKVRESRRGPTIEYEVPIHRIKAKKIYEMSFTNSGYFLHSAGKYDAFLHGKYPGIPNYDLMKEVKREELKELQIEVKNALLKKAIRELKRDYSIMIDQLKDYSKKLNFELFFAGHAQRTADIFYDLEYGLMACLSLPDDEKRLRSLETPMRWIYQLWIMKLICEALDIKKIEKDEWEEKPDWWIGQGRPSPTFVATNFDSYSLWFEFQPSRAAHLIGLFLGKRVPIRPDIAVCKGRFRDAKELQKIDLIVECKNEDFDVWKEEIETQIIPYFEGFKPTNMILVSMKQIPVTFKQKLEKVGIRAIGNLAPNDMAAIEEFKRVVKEILS